MPAACPCITSEHMGFAGKRWQAFCRREQEENFFQQLQEISLNRLAVIVFSNYKKSV
jgi:hypothetical protein